MTTDTGAPPTALVRCERCGRPDDENPPSCAGCGKRRPSCGCTKGWSQSQGVILGNPQHRCPHCSLSYP